MKATLVTRERHSVAEGAFAEIRIWRVPKRVAGSAHDYKYALAYIADDVCVLRYDNEAGKGDHRHIGDAETPYMFRSLEQLFADFWRDVNERTPR